MNLSQKGVKSKTSSKSKKGGNFLGSVSELFVPTGWENFATAAGLLAIDRADAAFRRSRNSNKKQKGGADLDGHESIETMDSMLDQIQSEGDFSSPNQMNGGGAKKGAKKGGNSKKTSESKKSSSTTRSKSKTKGGNFLGAVGDLVAPTGWGPFATAAGLLALDRADAALRRGTKEKKEKMNGGKKGEKKVEKKMKGGELSGMTCSHGKEPTFNHTNSNVNGPRGFKYMTCCQYKNYNECRSVTYDKRPTAGSPGSIDEVEEKKRFNKAKDLLVSYFKKKFPNNNN
jgi:hypothetical protein